MSSIAESASRQSIAIASSMSSTGQARHEAMADTAWVWAWPSSVVSPGCWSIGWLSVRGRTGIAFLGRGAPRLAELSVAVPERNGRDDLPALCRVP